MRYYLSSTIDDLQTVVKSISQARQLLSTKEEIMSLFDWFKKFFDKIRTALGNLVDWMKDHIIACAIFWPFFAAVLALGAVIWIVAGVAYIGAWIVHEAIIGLENLYDGLLNVIQDIIDIVGDIIEEVTSSVVSGLGPILAIGLAAVLLMNSGGGAPNKKGGAS
jgi:phage-related protein